MDSKSAKIFRRTYTEFIGNTIHTNLPAADDDFKS